MVTPILNKSIAVSDNRGVFSATPLPNTDWIQTNVSYNINKNTFRGMHLQKHPHSQTKLVKVINGSIIDIIIDLRKDSYLKIYSYEMNVGHELLVPKGFLHGFITLEEHTVVQYLIDHPYTPDSDVSINYKSFPHIEGLLKERGILSNDLIISDKDNDAPLFKTNEIMF